MSNVEDHELRMLLVHREREWSRKLADMKRQLRDQDEQIEREQKRASMRAYIDRRKVEERDEIAPELLDFIQGTTVEEIEAAITRAKAKTASILEGIFQATAQVPSAPAVISQAPQQLTLEQLQAVPVGSPEHMALRRQFGMSKGRGQGIFDQ